MDPESLLNFLARCLDAKVGRKVFIGIPGFSEEARKLAGAHGIEIIESSGSDVQEIAEKISTGMPQEQVSDGQLEEMIDSMREAVEEEDAPKPEQPDTESMSLEKMLRTIISRPKDDEGKQGS
ncbi:MAG TPA: hypothetical protein VI338_04800 [Nitrososphaera sp.]|nr:hypothetical protein [Nitrososphaera sp.]